MLRGVDMVFVFVHAAQDEAGPSDQHRQTGTRGHVPRNHVPILGGVLAFRQGTSLVHKAFTAAVQCRAAHTDESGDRDCSGILHQRPPQW